MALSHRADAFVTGLSKLCIMNNNKPSVIHRINPRRGMIVVTEKRRREQGRIVYTPP